MATLRAMECDVPRWVEQLARFSLVRVSCRIHVMRDLELRELACIQVRGQLGAFFREQRCLTGAPSCEGCGEAKECDFSRIFDANASPHKTPGYWLRGVPATSTLTASKQGQPSLFMLEQDASIPAFLGDSLRRSLLSLGRPANASSWQPALSTSPAQIERVALPRCPPARRWRIESRTPMDLRSDDPGRHQANCPEVPEFSLLVDAAIRRLHRLAQEALPGEEFPSLKRPDLRGVRKVEGGLEPHKARRFSHRQLQSMPIEGFDGMLLVEGDALEELSPLLGAAPHAERGQEDHDGAGLDRLRALLILSAARRASPGYPSRPGLPAGAALDSPRARERSRFSRAR
jgi:hypothetical protein